MNFWGPVNRGSGWPLFNSNFDQIIPFSSTHPFSLSQGRKQVRIIRGGDREILWKRGPEAEPLVGVRGEAIGKF